MSRRPTAQPPSESPLWPAVEEWLAHLAVERGLSRNTTAAYRRDLLAWVEHLDGRGQREWGRVTTQDVRDHLQALTASGLARSSVTRRLVAVRRFHAFALLEGWVGADVAAEVPPPAAAQRLPKALPLDQVQRLIEATGPVEGADDALATAVARRDRVLLELLYGTGARVSEVTGLDVDDVDLVAAVVRLVGKGGKERHVPLGGAASTAVSDWLTAGRPVLAARSGTSSPGPALLLNQRGRRLGRQSAWAAVVEAGERAGLDEPLSPHTLRHSYATHLMAGGADVRVVQELLGHASVTTTQIYTRVTPDHLREVFQQTHPRAR
ncbi:site-specific tyrosine recombinase XerD [Kytococcus sp. Marseille-QA3725]